MTVVTTEKIKNPRGRPKTINYDATLNIAMEAYWANGIDGMSVNEICRLADVSKPSLYREFGNEDELLSLVFKNYSLGLHASLTNLFEKNENFKDTINELVEFSGSVTKGCLAAKAFQAFSRLGEKGKKELNTLKQGTLRLFQDFVANSRQEISLGKNWDNFMIAEYIFSIFINAMGMSERGICPNKIKRTMSLALSPLVSD